MHSDGDVGVQVLQGGGQSVQIPELGKVVFGQAYMQVDSNRSRGGRQDVQVVDDPEH